MTHYSTKINCVGCRCSQRLSFEAIPSFTLIILPVTCKVCESELGVKVRPGSHRWQVKASVEMVKKGEKLLKLLKGEMTHAHCHS